jgi:ABC-type multidrug transport system ATPase subunit
LRTAGLGLQAYVEQNDNFYSMLTVAETLTMSSQLQLSPSMSADDKAEYVDNLIHVLGLAKVCFVCLPWHHFCLFCKSWFGK